MDFLGDVNTHPKIPLFDTLSYTVRMNWLIWDGDLAVEFHSKRHKSCDINFSSNNCDPISSIDVKGVMS